MCVCKREDPLFIHIKNTHTNTLHESRWKLHWVNWFLMFKNPDYNITLVIKIQYLTHINDTRGVLAEYTYN